MNRENFPSRLLVTIFILLIGMGGFYAYQYEASSDDEFDYRKMYLEVSRELRNFNNRICDPRYRCVKYEEDAQKRACEFLDENVRDDAVELQGCIGFVTRDGFDPGPEIVEGIEKRRASLIGGFLRSIHYPALTETTNPEAEQKINGQIIGLVRELVNDYEDRFDAHKENIRNWDQYLISGPGGGYMLRIRYAVEKPDTIEKVLSVQFWRDWDLSMAHPANDIHNLMFNLKTGEQIGLEDLFTDLNQRVTLEYVYNPAANRNNPNPNDYFSELEFSLSELPHVLVTNDGLHVTFDYYAIGCGRPCGQPEFNVSWEQLRANINPDGPLASLIE